MTFTQRERIVLINLVRYDLDHYLDEVERSKDILSYATDKEVIKQTKKSLKEYEKTVKENENILKKLRSV